MVIHLRQLKTKLVFPTWFFCCHKIYHLMRNAKTPIKLIANPVSNAYKSFLFFCFAFAPHIYLSTILSASCKTLSSQTTSEFFKINIACDIMSEFTLFNITTLCVVFFIPKFPFQPLYVRNTINKFVTNFQSCCII